MLSPGSPPVHRETPSPSLHWGCGVEWGQQLGGTGQTLPWLQSVLKSAGEKI